MLLRKMILSHSRIGADLARLLARMNLFLVCTARILEKIEKQYSSKQTTKQYTAGHPIFVI